MITKKIETSVNFENLKELQEYQKIFLKSR